MSDGDMMSVNSDTREGERYGGRDEDEEPER